MFLIYIYNFEHGLWSWLMIQVKVQIKLSLNSPNKRYKDNFKNALINCRIDQDHWAEIASDRDLCCGDNQSILQSLPSKKTESKLLKKREGRGRNTLQLQPTLPKILCMSVLTVIESASHR